MKFINGLGVIGWLLAVCFGRRAIKMYGNGVGLDLIMVTTV